MNTENFIIELYYIVDNNLPIKILNKSHKQRSLSHSEIITIGLLFSIKGFKGRAFYRWLSNNYKKFFPKIPDRTNLFRLMNTFSDLMKEFMSIETIFGVADSYVLELIHPRRENRTKNQIGKKGKSNHRWVVGVKVCPILNKFGLIVDYDIKTANVCDNSFQPLI
ncbi:MAG: transposase [Cyanobacteriota bacterium]